MSADHSYSDRLQTLLEKTDLTGETLGRAMILSRASARNRLNGLTAFRDALEEEDVSILREYFYEICDNSLPENQEEIRTLEHYTALLNLIEELYSQSLNHYFQMDASLGKLTGELGKILLAESARESLSRRPVVVTERDYKNALKQAFDLYIGGREHFSTTADLLFLALLYYHEMALLPPESELLQSRYKGTTNPLSDMLCDPSAMEVIGKLTEQYQDTDLSSEKKLYQILLEEYPRIFSCLKNELNSLFIPGLDFDDPFAPTISTRLIYDRKIYGFSLKVDEISLLETFDASGRGLAVLPNMLCTNASAEENIDLPANITAHLFSSLEKERTTELEECREQVYFSFSSIIRMEKLLELLAQKLDISEISAFAMGKTATFLYEKSKIYLEGGAQWIAKISADKKSPVKKLFTLKNEELLYPTKTNIDSTKKAVKQQSIPWICRNVNLLLDNLQTGELVVKKGEILS